MFVLSPDAARSPICRWEVGEATRLHKRVLPVVHRQTELTAIPQELAELNFIDMSKSDDRKVAVLAEAISTDIEWVREHTRIGERAEHWSAAKSAQQRIAARQRIGVGGTLASGPAEGRRAAERAASRVHCGEPAGGNAAAAFRARRRTPDVFFALAIPRR